jgi:hypothetical protein
VTDAADDVVKVDWGDGVSALDRVMRTITMAADGAIKELINRGYDRAADHITIEQHSEDTFPVWIRCRGRRVYEINIANVDGVVAVRGSWLRLGRWARWRMRVQGRDA